MIMKQQSYQKSRKHDAFEQKLCNVTVLVTDIITSTMQLRMTEGY